MLIGSRSSWSQWINVFVLMITSTNIRANLPTFDEDSRMRILLLPVSTRIGSTIYRIRASDPDFQHPLEFSFLSSSE